MNKNEDKGYIILEKDKVLSVGCDANCYSADSLDSLIYAFSELAKRKDKDKNKKQGKENIMEVLDIYINNQLDLLLQDKNEKAKKILEKDIIGNSISEINKKIAIIKNEKDENKNYISINIDLCEDFTKKEIEKIEKEYTNKREEFYKLQKEVVSMLNIAENYEQKMDILENYGIVRKGILVKEKRNKNIEENITKKKNK